MNSELSTAISFVATYFSLEEINKTNEVCLCKTTNPEIRNVRERP